MKEKNKRKEWKKRGRREGENYKIEGICQSKNEGKMKRKVKVETMKSMNKKKSIKKKSWNRKKNNNKKAEKTERKNTNLKKESLRTKRRRIKTLQW